LILKSEDEWKRTIEEGGNLKKVMEIHPGPQALAQGIQDPGTEAASGGHDGGGRQELCTVAASLEYRGGVLRDR
jgi:hypothetical protein